MRWNGQRVVDGDLVAAPTLPGLPGLVRSVRTPDFQGIVFHEVAAKSALNRVPGESAMPFRWTVNPYRGCSHACTYCLSADTPVLLADGRTRPIADLKVGDAIYGTRRVGSYRRYVRTEVLAHWLTVKPAYRVVLEDGTELVASGDHRFLTDRGWKHVVGGMCGAGRRPYLTTGAKLVGTGQFAAPPEATSSYRSGYLRGVIRGDGTVGRYAYERSRRSNGDIHSFRLALADFEALDRARAYLAGFGVPTSAFVFAAEAVDRRETREITTAERAAVDAISEIIRWPAVPDADWSRGFLAGIFDAEGSCSQGVFRIPNTNDEIITATGLALKRFGFEHVVEDRALADGLRAVRLLGGLPERLRFFHTVDPAITRKRTIDGVAIKSNARLGVVSVEPLGMELPLYDITTGTGDFIANGVVSHNCFARRSHTYLDLDAGRDFDSQVIVKVNVGEVLARELAAPRWRREHVAMGTNTDPYQRAEGRYQLMPGVISALAGSGTPFSVLTKGTLLARDLPLLADAAQEVPVGLGVSIALLDRELQASLEPGTPSPQARLDLVRKARDAGLPCGVFVAPVLPWLTDSVAALDDLFGAIAEAGATGVTVLPLHLRPGAREWFMAWLEREHPKLVPGYRRIYARGSYADARYRKWLAERVRPLVRKHGLETKGSARKESPLRGISSDEEGDWPNGALPAVDGPPAACSGPGGQEQLTLL
ncbi:intein-containing Rv2578c family radical SAM protein [Streptoalloteichus hindustanus]|uniref:Intein C-terminal splicing region/intein N-terminal splicing region n=1 Tax=Streptoalloteichus hindustanus TaxID=2017 RepID=A0A1M5HC19_STRHI|nr:intein-containing Rv2578c family radical SAM protein [Streptoalloteichus hindustanus]SHG13438.1 intein C-terminal splicing region/intein N-terminal splicing region [Streptoalloteichus hindustanus]